MFTGIAIEGGHDPFRVVVEPPLREAGFRTSYREVDPDVFGEELARIGPFQRVPAPDPAAHGMAPAATVPIPAIIDLSHLGRMNAAGRQLAARPSVAGPAIPPGPAHPQQHREQVEPMRDTPHPLLAGAARCVIASAICLQLGACASYDGPVTNAKPHADNEGPPLLTNGLAP